MSGVWPGGLELANAQTYGFVSGSSAGTTITPGSSVNTKGAWTQLVASTSYDCCWFLVSMFCETTNSAQQNVAVDIGIGSSGNEIVLVPNLIMSSGYDAPNCVMAMFPCSIPAGTRIAARAQESSGATTTTYLWVEVTCFDAGWHTTEGSSAIDVIGFNSGSTTGTVVDSGSTANTKGAYSQLTASTANDYQGFFLAFDAAPQTAANNSTYIVDLAVGGSGSEQVILPNQQIIGAQMTAKDIMIPGFTPFIPISIPAGTRIAARSQASTNSSGVRQLGVTMYGVR